MIWNLIWFYVCMIIVTAFTWCLWAKRAFNTHICKHPHWFSFWNAAVSLRLLQILSEWGSESLSVAWLIQVSLMISSLYKAAIRVEDMKTRGTLSSKQASCKATVDIHKQQSKWIAVELFCHICQSNYKQKWMFRVVQLVSEIRENFLRTS